jgi:hypothetical protein
VPLVEGAGDEPSRIRRARARSSAPSHFAITIVATALPMRFVIARASDMKRSTPRSSVNPATGIAGNAASVAASVTNPLPVTAAAPFDVRSSTARIPSSCPIVRCTSLACATKIAAIVM